MLLLYKRVCRQHTSVLCLRSSAAVDAPKNSKVMSQVKPMALVESMSGKICGHSDMYFFRKNGKVFSGKICNPSTKEPSATQLAAQAKFKTARTNAKAALADATQRAAYEEAFKNQKKYYSLYGYVFAQEYAKLGD